MRSTCLGVPSAAMFCSRGSARANAMRDEARYGWKPCRLAAAKEDLRAVTAQHALVPGLLHRGENLSLGDDDGAGEWEILLGDSLRDQPRHLPRIDRDAMQACAARLGGKLGPRPLIPFRG